MSIRNVFCMYLCSYTTTIVWCFLINSAHLVQSFFSLYLNQSSKNFNSKSWKHICEINMGFNHFTNRIEIWPNMSYQALVVEEGLYSIFYFITYLFCLGQCGTIICIWTNTKLINRIFEFAFCFFQSYRRWVLSAIPSTN